MSFGQKLHKLKNLNLLLTKAKRITTIKRRAFANVPSKSPKQK